MTREKAPNWDASCIPSQAGKVAIVTGANSGVGFDTALELARRGARVVLACRNPERGEDAEQRIRQGLADLRPHVEFMRLDLSDLDSVRAFAAAFTAKFDRLDILVNNAGLLLPEQTHTETGLEMQFAVNYLGHFLLTQLLFDVLKRSELPSRVVNVSSAGHRLARLDLATVARATPAKGHGMNEYYCSKLANLLFTYELDRRINAAGLSSRVLSVAAHPGIVESELPQKVAAKFTPKFMTNVVRSVVRHLPILQDTEFGALPVLFAATDSGVQGGAFFGPNGVTTIWGKAPAREKSSSESYSQELAASLWQLGEETAGCTFVVAP